MTKTSKHKRYETTRKHKIKELNSWGTQKSLKLAPPFQRKSVWNEKHKSYLIDSVLEGYSVPEIYLQISKGYHTVVDGQQRVRAILEYIRNDYAVRKSESKKHGGKKFDDLSINLRKKFLNFNLTTRELKNYSKLEVKELYKRLNKYVFSLNKQEIRKSTYEGEFIKLIKTLTNSVYWLENKIVNTNEIKRMTDDEFISELVISIIDGIQTKSPGNIDKFYALYDETFSNKDAVKRNFNNVLKTMKSVIGNLSPTTWHRKPNFYRLFVAFSELMKDYRFTPSAKKKIKNKLLDFSADVDRFDRQEELKSFERQKISEFHKSVTEHTTNSESRKEGKTMIKEIVIPYLVLLDPKRKFTEEERRIRWHLSRNKKCYFCGKQVTWNTYDLNHKIMHVKGGVTLLQNSAIAHSKCNRQHNIS